MDCFSYTDGVLFAEDVDVRRIAAEAGTPTYVYSRATLADHLEKVQTAYRDLDTTVCYSVKACGNIHVLRSLSELGSGFDVVSGGELHRVLTAGGDPGKVVFAGVGKTDAEIREALAAKIAYFNIESEAELDNLIRLAAQDSTAGSTKPKAALRVNPDIDYGEHALLKTGRKETKFGVDIEQALRLFDRYADNPSVELCAIHVHLGTGGKTIDPYVLAVEKTVTVIDALRDKGHTIEALDLGGGYAADYESDTSPSATDYAGGIVPLLAAKNLKLILEPGKSICANAGILLTRVLYTKRGGSKKFVIVDAAMNDLIRPSLYDAFHFVWPVQTEAPLGPPARRKDPGVAGTEIVDIVGPICEGTDFLAKDRPIPPVQRGDLLAVFTAGAYAFTMSSNYNARPRACEVLVDGGQFSIIRRRETYEDLIAPEL